MAGYPVLDSDSHIRETIDDYRSRIPEQFQRIRQGLFPSDTWDRFLGRMGKQTVGMDGYVADMDVEGIQLTVTYPTMGLNLSLVPQTDLSKALARAWNDYIGEIQQQNPRMKGIATVSLKDVPAAVEELNRAVNKWHHPGVMIHTHGHKKNLGAEEFWPIYAEAERLGVPVCFHGNSWGAEGQERWECFLQAHTVSFSFEIMQAFLGIVTCGVMERFPNLKLGFFEAGCGWLPYWLDRIDEHYERRSEEAPMLKGKPSEYVTSGRVYVSFDPDDAMLPYCMDRYGDDMWLFAADYPHWDTIWPNATKEVRERTDISEGPEAEGLLRELQPLLLAGAGGLTAGPQRAVTDPNDDEGPEMDRRRGPLAARRLRRREGAGVRRLEEAPDRPRRRLSVPAVVRGRGASLDARSGGRREPAGPQERRLPSTRAPARHAHDPDGHGQPSDHHRYDEGRCTG